MLFELSETKIDMDEIVINLEHSSTSGYLADLWSKLETNFDNTLPFMEETIEKWNTRTQLYKNINQDKNKHNKQLNKSVLEFVTASLNDEDTRQKISRRHRIKRYTMTTTSTRYY